MSSGVYLSAAEKLFSNPPSPTILIAFYRDPALGTATVPAIAAFDAPFEYLATVSPDPRVGRSVLLDACLVER